MDDEYSEVFNQDGVLLKQATASYMSLLGAVGNLSILEASEEASSAKNCLIEWKLIDVTVDSEVQDQEWAVVNTVQRRVRTISGNLPLDYYSRLRSLRISLDEVKSFRVSNKNRQVTFFDGSSEILCGFIFQHGNSDVFINMLKKSLKVMTSRRDKHLFIVYDDDSPGYQELNKTFAALDLKSDNSLWTLFKNIKEHPYEGSMEAFAKVTNYVYSSMDAGETPSFSQEDLNRSLSEIDEGTTTHSGGDYEVVQDVPKLPDRKDFPRCKPLNEEQWKAQLNFVGQLEDVDSIKVLIFRGGICSTIRKEVWKFLLEYYPWNSTQSERQKLINEKRDEYYVMKLQWKSISKTQEENFSDFAQRKSLVEKDVNRTDRNLEFYAGDNNFNLQTLNDILMTYVMYNFDLGYVQGMSDLLSPLFMLLQDESEAFWCFVGFINKLISNFDIDQAGMKEQLSNVYTLLSFVDPVLANYLETHDCANMFFCFRWLLVWFKRELNQEEAMRFWEVLWTGYPCENFHLLISVAILEHERAALMENDYGFTEILKYINELSGKLDMPLMLNKAEGIFYQIKEADHLTDNIRFILGLPIVRNQLSGSSRASPYGSPPPNSSGPDSSVVILSSSPSEASFDKSINSNFL